MALRNFTAPDGRSWDVWAVVPSTARPSVAVQPEFVDGWLCFESGGLKRRLAGIPDGWDEAPEDRLHLLWRAAAEAAPRAPRGPLPTPGPEA
jgi:hypothetical protein